jgi:protein-tyrosine kinase
MSEIFDALLKAQRDVQSRRGAAEQRGVAGDEEPSIVRLNGAAAEPRRRKIGWLSWLRRNGKDDAPEPFNLLIDPSGEGELAESFRMLRGYLLGIEGSMVMITSALGEEGKTLCAANLAISLALRSSRDVVVVDLDLRRPALSKRLGVPSSPGVVECLSGGARWQDCLRPTTYPKLLVLPAGNHLKSAPELLASEALSRLLVELRSYAQSHFVLFDTPPVLLTADALTVVAEMDRVVFVVRAASTSRTAVEKAIAAIGQEKLLGVVFNQANAQASDYYHFGSRYDYYGDYYGGYYGRDKGK